MYGNGMYIYIDLGKENDIDIISSVLLKMYIHILCMFKHTS